MFDVIPMVATENTYRRYTKKKEKGIKACNCKKKKKSTKQEERQQEGKRVTKKPQDRKKTS